MRCDRCKKETDATIMSRFNTDILCPDCEEAERKHPRYEEAREAELEPAAGATSTSPGSDCERSRTMNRERTVAFMTSIAAEHLVEVSESNLGVDVNYDSLVAAAAEHFGAKRAPLEAWDWAADAAARYFQETDR